MGKSTVLKFELLVDGVLEKTTALMDEFFPNGETLLNRDEWRGKEPRSCGVTKLSSSNQPNKLLIEVAYRPKGFINYVGETRYDGWDAAPLDRKPDGTLLDGNGNPLPEGSQSVYRTIQVLRDTPFSELQLGDFVGEYSLDLPRLTFEEVMSQLKTAPSFSMGAKTIFVAPHRNRPTKKLILSRSPTGDSQDGFGTRIRNICLETEHLEQVLMSEVTELVCGYLEGRYSITSIGSNKFTFVDLSSTLIDCTLNEDGFDSWFQVLSYYTPVTFLEELANRIQTKYAVSVSIVDGRRCGLVLQNDFGS